MDRPILFSGPMVRALLAGSKTQTRRIVKPQPIVHPAGNWSWEGRNGGFVGAAGTHLDEGFPASARHWVRTQPGDRLWVREAHYLTDDGDYERAVFAVDVEVVREHLASIERLKVSHPQADWSRHARLRPGIHMPRWASRLTLTVTDVRVQRLQDISEEDAQAEGAEIDQQLRDAGLTATYRGGFANVWAAIHEPHPDNPTAWGNNPWVAAYTFSVERLNIDESVGKLADANPKESPPR